MVPCSQRAAAAVPAGSGARSGATSSDTYLSPPSAWVSASRAQALETSSMTRRQ